MKIYLLGLFLALGIGTSTALIAAQTNDTDGDLIPDSSDRCPQIPSNNNASGCPVFTLTPPNQDSNGITVINLGTRPDLAVQLQPEIAPGDIFYATIKNLKTGEIYHRSNPIVAH